MATATKTPRAALAAKTKADARGANHSHPATGHSEPVGEALGGSTPSPQASPRSMPTEQAPGGNQDAHTDLPKGDTLPETVGVCSTPVRPDQIKPDTHGAAVGVDSELRAWARLLDDAEACRIACSNRIDALSRDGHIAGRDLTGALDHFKAAERAIVRQVERAYRAQPISEFTAPIPGVGDKLMGRLIAEIGDPATRPNVAKLWAYCGVGDPERRKRRGMSQEEALKLGSPRAKSILLGPTGLAAQLVMHRAEPYRSIYDERKARYEESRPDWPLFRRDRAARRVAVKALLRDLWVASKETA